MIDLTRLNGHRLILNCDLIRFAEPAPDTTITLVTGEKLIVRESCDELIARMLAWRGSVLRTAWPDAASALFAKTDDLAHKHAHAHPKHDSDC
ncbi:flagellar FlbD family protein [Granulicella tundricola]|uniref:Flagellar FlbD family protein n=1 Tax=Granulicella tundricola (strain ATCC BAA-1859 / DSM 23138 / MP5ACTX9) TaxID=1198114 RepID=E8WW72_GRATM|nr:flagellar FlbD family protein [Granulicella tundricola]ADW68455.1 flagellar FlbD family protein [Granulicella tundricola MP5ACTX9]